MDTYLRVSAQSRKEKKKEVLLADQLIWGLLLHFYINDINLSKFKHLFLPFWGCLKAKLQSCQVSCPIIIAGTDVGSLSFSQPRLCHRSDRTAHHQPESLLSVTLQSVSFCLAGSLSFLSAHLFDPRIGCFWSVKVSLINTHPEFSQG